MGKILVIDDDEFVRSLVTRALEREGHTVVTAPDGESGLERFRGGAFDVVVTDILMPGKEGIELIMELRETHPDTPIVAMSGGGGATGSAGPLQDARLLGADATLSKPFEIESLRRMVNGLLAGAST